MDAHANQPKSQWINMNIILSQSICIHNFSYINFIWNCIKSKCAKGKKIFRYFNLSNDYSLDSCWFNNGLHNASLIKVHSMPIAWQALMVGALGNAYHAMKATPETVLCKITTMYHKNKLWWIVITCTLRIVTCSLCLQSIYSCLDKGTASSNMKINISWHLLFLLVVCLHNESIINKMK